MRDEMRAIAHISYRVSHGRLTTRRNRDNARKRLRCVRCARRDRRWLRGRLLAFVGCDLDHIWACAAVGERAIAVRRRRAARG
jgi:hypothetical protein